MILIFSYSSWTPEGAAVRLANSNWLVNGERAGVFKRKTGIHINMAAENNNRTASDVNSIEEGVSFSHITVVATGWMSDFMFLSLCRRFKESKRDEFNETLSAFQSE